MSKPALSLLALILLAPAILPQTPPLSQPSGSWRFQYRKAQVGDVTHVYENGFVWDTRNSLGLVFGGHLGTKPSADADYIGWGVPEILNTNMTYGFSFDNNAFSKILPMDRPPKRCGVKIVYDDALNLTYSYAGAYHHYFNGLLEPNFTLSALVNEGYRNTQYNPVNIWAFDGADRQWRPLRPLVSETQMAGDFDFTGFYFKMVSAREYGLILLMRTKLNTVLAYSGHFNQWTRIPKNPADAVFPPETPRICAAYDLKHRKLVAHWGNDAANTGHTWTYDVGAHQWTRLSADRYPNAGRNGTLWDKHASMAYDSRNGVSVLLRHDGSETWALNLDSAGWRQVTTDGRPGSSGTNADGLAYDPKNNASLLYAVDSDEVWSFKAGAGDNRPNPPREAVGVASASGLTLSWTAPEGAAPVKYRVYRAQWDDNKSATFTLVPGPYVLLDSAIATTWTDTQTSVLKADSVFHSYYISSVNAGGESDPSTPAYSILPVPRGLTTTALTQNSVFLRWKPMAQPDLAGYNIYRMQKQYGGHRKMKSTKLNSSPVVWPSTYTDNTVSLSPSVGLDPRTEVDSISMYVVTAVNRLGKESGFSGYALTQPDWVNNLWVDTVNRFLTWSPPRNGNIGKYFIYGSRQTSWFDTVNAYYPLIIDSTADTFWSYRSQPDRAYKIRARNTLGQMGFFSDVMAVQWKDADDSGNYRLDYQMLKPVRDAYYDDLPPIAAEFGAAADRAPALSLFPNPFNPAVTFRIASAAAVTGCGLYDLRGRLVTRLDPGTFRKNGTGAQEIVWKPGRDSAPGVYMARVECGKTVFTRKLVLSR